MEPSSQDPDAAEAVVVSSTKKGFSGKQKLFGGLASVIALVGIGFGGLTAWQGLSSNAADETSLGNTATVEVPVESPYFKITAFDQQNVKLVADGEAERIGDSSSLMVKAGWRIERTTTPDDTASWKVALDSTVNSYTPEGSEGQFPGMYDKASIVIDPASPDCSYCQGSGDLSARMRDPASIQPGTTYFYRAARLAADGTTWEAQGPNVPVTTLTYPTVDTSKVDGNLVTTKWTESHPVGEGLMNERIGLYELDRTTDPNLFKKYQLAKYSNENFFNILPGAIQNEISMTQASRLPSGEVGQAQPKSSTYYYVIALRIGDGVIPVMDPKQVTTTTSDPTGLIGVTLAPTTAAWTQQSTVKATVTQLIPGKVDYSSYNLSNAQGASTNKCNSWITPANTGQGQYITAVTTTMPVCTSSTGTLYASAITTTIKAFASTPGGQVQQIVSRPFTLTKVNSSMTAAYADPTIKAYNGYAYATINVKTPAISGKQPVGTLRVKNLVTGSFIYNYNSANPFTIPTSMQVKPLMKPGSYRLALVFTEKNVNGSYFNSKTINLPLLTVSK